MRALKQVGGKLAQDVRLWQERLSVLGDSHESYWGTRRCLFTTLLADSDPSGSWNNQF